LAALSALITERFLAGRTGFDEEVIITNERQAGLLRKAEEALLAAEEAAKAGLPADVYVLDLTDAAHALGQITGEDAGEEIIEEIFSKFCMGK
ncbi:MAG: tRNA uridine-5-carboxymethylaminomethyl(34) synthesis GTPase MnmE, partial [Lachnospiraceae bacterium]|nr:tRNA uridine-5-carboxymethylaminomethyl(34) synthesis GTPase MnmE [Lachnospiraceae bacterium]